MQNLQMVDLKRQYQKIKPEIDKAIQDVIDSTMFIGGSNVQQLSLELAQYMGVKHMIPCANGTDALQIALMALNLEQGDEVITTSFTFMATAEVIALMNLKPVFVDVDADTFTMSVTSLKNAITPKTKAIIPVHLYGQTANMEPILEIAKEHNIPVIEDNAQAIGGNYTFSDGRTVKNGSMGLISTTSFFPSKNLGCYGDGGAIFTNDDELAVKLKMIANHGQKTRYYHEMVGLNSRLDNIQAAVLRVKLPHLDEYCAARRSVADYYDKAFAGNEYVITPQRASYSYHVFHQYTLRLNGVNRDEVHRLLGERKIPAMIYYPVPCHKQEMMRPFGGAEFNLPVTDALQDCVISLPIHTEMTEEEMAFISVNFLEIIAQSA